MTIEELQELASARHYAYAAFQRLVGDAPTVELLSVLDTDVLRMAFEAAGCLPAAQSEFDALAEQLECAEGDLERAAEDYARIFVGPAALPAPAWESVYRGNKRMLMTATTLSVREFYHACGYEAQAHHRVPDDHLAIELDFLSALAQDALDACAADEGERACDLLDAGTSFLKAHLALWIEPFASELHDKSGSPFYRAVADALSAFVSGDCSVSDCSERG